MLAGRDDAVLERLPGVARRVSDNPYNLYLRYAYASQYCRLGFPDLAAGEAYKCLLLVDEASDESFEYYELAKEWPCAQDDGLEATCKKWKCRATALLTSLLLAIDCLKPAHQYATQLVNEDQELSRCMLLEVRCRAGTKDDSSSRPSPRYYREVIDEDGLVHISPTSDGDYAPSQSTEDNVDSQTLAELSYIRREIYPWNEHEADRNTDAALAMLNGQMLAVAPHLEVRVTELPLLIQGATEGTSRQLGVFAKEPLQPGEEILCERSLLTANSRLKEPLCDACSAKLPDIVMGTGQASDSDTTPIPCPECDDIVFCSQECLDLAQESYHPAICGMDVETLSKDVPAAQAADALYTNLLYRALAMAITQDVHPLDLNEVKYIWGDFTPPTTLLTTNNHDDQPKTLPFTFENNILAPLHFLEKADIDIFASPNGIAEPWVWNTLYAKFRGTASARISERDGRPEVAAVHPLWCLANHDCDPNVTWEWAGEVRFQVREARKGWERVNGAETEGAKRAETEEGTGGEVQRMESRAAGIQAGEEILNHYVDIRLPVQARREWGAGALGGACRCGRCRWEAGEVE